MISTFMATGACCQVLRDALPIHPTVAKFLRFLLNKLEPLRQCGPALPGDTKRHTGCVRIGCAATR